MSEEKLNEQASASAAAPDAEAGATVETEAEQAPRSKKRTILWIGAFALGLVLIAIIATMVEHAMTRTPAKAVHKAAVATAPAVTVQAPQQTTVVVPAVRGVDATGCQDADLVVEGNRLVFKNGCARPVFYGK